MFKRIIDWLRRMVINVAGILFRWLIAPLGSIVPANLRDLFSRLFFGPRPLIMRFVVLNHAVCGTANDEASGFRLSYRIDPNGATINSIEILRIYTFGAPPFLEPSPPSRLPTARLPTGEYFESVFRVAAPISAENLNNQVPDTGLETGQHWGHTVFYHQYRIMVQTPDRSISQSVEVSFSPKPSVNVASFGRIVRLGTVNRNPNWADVRWQLDNVKAIIATKGKEILEIFPAPIEYSDDGAGRIVDVGAHLCLFSKIGFALSDIRTGTVQFTFLPFEDGDGDCPREPLLWADVPIGTSDIELQCPPPA